ncbi:MAG: T9SS type A sorting domain-containing protein [Bacteroidetes bacterium]|nr:T9SS type A sorting domain-containing protein [Bacteroidota bacterium]
MKIGKEDGNSICFDNIDNNPENDASNSGTFSNTLHDPITNSINGYRKMGDAMAQHGEYISVLATEYKLLNDKGKDCTAILNELYYAILSVQRVDEVAEQYFGNATTNFNGFFIRDDAKPSFASDWVTEFTHTEDPKDNYYGISSNYYKDITPFATNMNNEMSHDQMYGLMQGFLFVKKYIGHVYVKPTADDIGFYLDDKVKEITEKFMNYVTSIHTKTNAHNELLKFDLADLNWLYTTTILAPVPHTIPPVGPVIVFPNDTQVIYTTCTVSENWIILNPITQEKVGNGSEMRPFAFPVCKVGEKLTGNNYTSFFNTASRIHYSTIDAPFDGEFCIPFALDIPIDDLKGTHWEQVQYLGAILHPNTLGDNTPKFCVSINPWPIASALGAESVQLCFASYNTFMALQLASMSGTWDHQIVSNIAENWHMEIFDLLYAVMNDRSPIHPKSYWENFLNSAPCKGPYNYKYKDINGNVIHDYDPNGWYENTRWAGAIAPSPYTFGEFNGNDYMLLYNLYRIAYGDQLSLDEYTDISCPCENSPKLQANTNVSAQTLVNNTVVKRKFANDYLPIGIKLKEFSINNLQIPSAKQLDVQTDLVVCNNSTMKIKNGGKIVVGDAASPQSSIIVRSGSSLHIEGNGRLTINDNCKVIIEKGASLVYDAGAIIQLLGNDAVLEIQGDLVLGNTAVFKFTYPNATSGYIKFSDHDFAQAPYDQIRTVSPGQTASIELRGANKNDKILEVDQDLLQVAIGNGITTFKVEYGLVDFTYNSGACYISSDANVRFYNSKFTKAPSMPPSAGQLSNVAVWGQAQCQITACEFSPNVGLIGNLFAYGNKLTVTGTLAYGGIRTQGAGLTLNSVTTSSLTSELMSFNSIATNSKFIDGEGASIIASPVEFDFNSCRANNNNFSGYRVDGPTLLKVKCGQVKTNQYTGFYLANNASLSMNVTDNGGYVDARDNAVNTILLDNAHSIDIENGYNDLRPYDFYSVTSSQTSSSTCVNYADCGYVVIEGSIQQLPANPILSDNNRWQLSTNNALFPLQATNGKDKYTRVSSTYSLPGSNDVRFVASSQSPIVACDYWNTSCTTCPKSYLEICPTCHVINTDDFTNVKTNEAVKSAITKLETASIDTTANKESVDMLYQVLQYPLPVANDGDKYVKSIAEKKILVALANGIEKSEIKVSDQQLSPEVMKVLEVVDSKILKAQADNNYNHLQNAVYEKALLYYSSKHRADALSTLNQYLPSIQPKDLDRFNRLVCQITNEQQLLNGEISQYDYLRSMENCVPIQKREGSRRTLTIPLEESAEIETLAVQVYPNPAEDQLNVQFSQALLLDTSFNIYDLAGKLVFSTQLKAGTEKSEITGFDLSNGMYIYKVSSGGEVLQQGKLSIIK